MINTSMEYKREIAGKNRKIVSKASCTLWDGTNLEFNSGKLMGGGVRITDATSSSGSFDIGSVIVNQATLMIDNTDEELSEYDFENAKLAVFCGLQLPDRTEWLKKGMFTVNDQNTTPSIITLKAVDNMSKFEKDYTGGIVFPVSLLDIVEHCCLKCGVILSTREFPNASYMVQKNPFEEKDHVTYRMLIAYCAVIAGCYVRCNADGALTLSWYDTTVWDDMVDAGEFGDAASDEIDAGEFENMATDVVDAGEFAEVFGKYHHIHNLSSLTVAWEDVVITGVRVTASNGEDVTGGEVDGETYLSGEEGYVLDIKDNPLIEYGRAREVADYLASRINGMRFRPMNGNVLGDPSWEAGDAVMITDRKYRDYFCYLTNINYQVGSYASISCDAKTPSRNNAKRYSDIQMVETEIKKAAEKKMSSYAEHLQNMNMLAANAMGYYETTERQSDGSTITYMHDKPLLSESEVVFKKSIDGYFWSKDGGKTWTSGISKDGNAVLNTLAAVGIIADWIIAGILKSENWKENESGFMLDLDNGIINSRHLKLDESGLLTIYKALISGGEIIINDSSGNPIFEVTEENGFRVAEVMRYNMTDKTLDMWKNTRLFGTITNYVVGEDGKTIKPSVRIGNNQIDLFSWQSGGDYVGTIGALRDEMHSRQSVGILCDSSDQIVLGYITGYDDDGKPQFSNFARFDPLNIENDPLDYNKERPVMLQSVPRISGAWNGSFYVGPSRLHFRSGILMKIESGSTISGTFSTGAGETVTVTNGVITGVG